MRWRTVGAVLVGSVVVASACASTNNAGSGAEDGGVVDALADALGLDHVEGEVMAAEKPTITEVACASDGAGNMIAKLDMPGRGRDDIGRATALGCKDGSEWCYQSLAQVKDGAVRVVCNGAFDRVRFVVPPTP